MDNKVVPVLILVVAVVGVAAYFRFGKYMRQKYYAASENHGYGKRVIGRSLVATCFLGWGFIGTEGFGLPAPIIPGLAFGILHDVTAPPHMQSIFILNVAAFVAWWILAAIYFAVGE